MKQHLFVNRETMVMSGAVKKALTIHEYDGNETHTEDSIRAWICQCLEFAVFLCANILSMNVVSLGFTITIRRTESTRRWLNGQGTPVPPLCLL